MIANELGLGIEPASARDVPALAALHRTCLPDSMISMLGAAAVERYYSLVTTSPFEHVLVTRAEEDRSRQDAKIAKQRVAEEMGAGDEGGTVGGAAEHKDRPPPSAWRTTTAVGAVAAACVLSLEPQTVMRRFVSSNPLRFAADLAHRSLTPAFRRRLLARLGEGAGTPGAGVPEVTQIFTETAQRGKGLGSRLLRACEDRLRELGQLTYCIHTLRDDNDAGIRFYRREGFTQTGSSRSFGDHYLVMTKGL